MPILPENRARYPTDWPAISRRIRFWRAGGRCECVGECGVQHAGRCARHNGDNAGTVLTVGHLDHVPENCSDENLRAWCQGCHNRYDRAHRDATRARRAREAVEQLGQLTLPGDVA